jgi:hypothetical protein
MLNLFTKRWEDQKGVVWNLPDLGWPHLVNIQKMLQNVISGDRELPPGSYQTKLELKASLRIINEEITRRKRLGLDSYQATPTVGVSSKTASTLIIPVGTSVAAIISALEKISSDAKFAGMVNTNNFVFIG